MKDTQDLHSLASKIKTMKSTPHNTSVSAIYGCLEDIFDILLEMNNMELHTDCNDSVCVQTRGKVGNLYNDHPRDN
jgi:hypothetical protein